MRAPAQGRTLLFAVFVLSFCASTSAQQDYEIKLTRPSKVGDRYVYKATGSQSTRTVMHIGSERTPPKLEETAVSLEANATVKEVNEQGTATQIEYQVLKCTKTADGNSSELVSPGKTIIATAGGGESSLKFKDGIIADETRALLTLVIEVSEEDDDNDEESDDAFGTSEPKKVGDAWPVNAEAIARQIARHGGVVKPSAIKGKSRLESVSTVGGEPCMEVSSSVTVRGFLPGADELPPGLKVQNAVVKIEVTGTYPVDLTKDVRAGSFVMEVEAELGPSSATSGPPMKVARAGKRQSSFTATPIKSDS